jgi:predicted aldo/keto reductase-like oxidoreductase
MLARMKYRSFGRLGKEISALGFGAMRLPTRGDGNEVDEDLAVCLMRAAFDGGVNYVDTAYPYHGGTSEPIVARALRDGYREKVYLATKMPVWLVEKTRDFDRFLDTQLQKLDTDRIDFYLLHNLQRHSWSKMKNLGVLRWGERARADGRIGWFGFSFHDSYEVFQRILDEYSEWSFCQIQYNYINEEVQAGTRGLMLAASRNLAVVVMEPLLGGSLADPPQNVRNVLASASPSRTPADWALQWLWNKQEVSLVLSGMNTMEQVEQNLDSARSSGVGTMSSGEQETIRRAQEAYRQYSPIPCTRCGYCLPCPQGVDIPKNFELYNDAIVMGRNTARLNRNLYSQMQGQRTAGHCVQCGECDDKCPQAIPISEWMPKVHETLSGL